MRRPPRAGTAVLLGLLLTALAVLAAGPAHATGYRYWSFWHADEDGWTYAQQGPGSARPDDGSVDGWRFAISEDRASEAKTPRGAANFNAICADTPGVSGRKRVALVIDFGTAGDAPDGRQPPPQRTACAVVARNATSADALAAVAGPLRYDSHLLLCAIAGYPKSGCGETVSGRDPAASASSEALDGTDDSDGLSVGLWVGLAVVVALGSAAVWQSRRRRS